MFPVWIEENIFKSVSLNLDEENFQYDLISNDDIDFGFTKCKSLDSYFNRFQSISFDKRYVDHYKLSFENSISRKLYNNLEELEREQIVLNEQMEWLSKIKDRSNSWILKIRNFQEIDFYIPYDLRHFAIFVDLDHTIIKPIMEWNPEKNKHGWKEDRWISNTIQDCIHQWKERGAHIFFLTHRYFDNDSLAQIESVFQTNGIHSEYLSKDMDSFWIEESKKAFPIPSKLLLLNQEKDKREEHLLFSYYIRNILFSRGNLERENEARRLYEIKELLSVEMENIQSIHSTLTNHKGETAKQFIRCFNHFHMENENIKYAIVIDDNMTFVHHVVNTLNEEKLITKGFCIKWNLDYDV